jgi:putative glycerol-1-phosphate prenyltransferase
LSILKLFQNQKLLASKQLAVLIDPDHSDEKQLDKIILSGEPDIWLIGGSLVFSGSIEESIKRIKKRSNNPCIIFPSSPSHISSEADAFLLLSLVSGRNPDLLIGRHVEAAMELDRSGLEIIPTAYMLIDGGVTTTAHFVSQTLPLPNNKPGIAVSTALAAQQLGMKLIYMDTGSGAVEAVSDGMIRSVKSMVELPLFVGGGIRSAEQAYLAWQSGADVVVVGNAIESRPEFLSELLEAKGLFQS